MRRIARKKFTLKNTYLIIIIFFILLSLPYGFSILKSSRNLGGDVQAAKWDFKINDNDLSELSINLANTLVNNNYNTTKVIPGTKGVINLSLDFSSVEVSAIYSVTLSEKTSLPTNLKIYSDADMTEEFTGFSGDIKVASSSKTINKKIYWQWVFSDDDETAWADKKINLVLDANAKQKVNS